MFIGRGGKTSSICILCGREGTVTIDRSAFCRYCIPIGRNTDTLKVEDVKNLHIKDAELLGRIESFQDTETLADLHFDDEHKLFFKGPYPNYTIPILAYKEIIGYRISVDGNPLAYDSIGGQRAKFRVTTDENIRAACKNLERITLELDSGRPNVKFRPYDIQVGGGRFSGSWKEDSFRLALKISDRLDSIVEDNILNCRNVS